MLPMQTGHIIVYPCKPQRTFADRVFADNTFAGNVSADTTFVTPCFETLYLLTLCFHTLIKNLLFRCSQCLLVLLPLRLEARVIH